jgi:hypothetical protein
MCHLHYSVAALDISYEVLTEVTIKITVLWGVISCSFADNCLTFLGSLILSCSWQKSEDGGNMFFRIFGTSPPNYTASHANSITRNTFWKVSFFLQTTGRSCASVSGFNWNLDVAKILNPPWQVIRWHK